MNFLFFNKKNQKTENNFQNKLLLKPSDFKNLAY